MAVIAAGTVANLLLAVTVYATPRVTDGERAHLPVATVIVNGSSHDHAGPRPGDRILGAVGTATAMFGELRAVLTTDRGSRSKCTLIDPAGDGRVRG